MFEEKGINPVKDFKKVIFSGGHDATVLAVLNHKVDAGATFANFPDGKDAAKFVGPERTTDRADPAEGTRARNPVLYSYGLHRSC